jgi:hypothetical protein
VHKSNDGGDLVNPTSYLDVLNSSV